MMHPYSKIADFHVIVGHVGVADSRGTVLRVTVGHIGVADSRGTVLRPSGAVSICSKCSFLSQLAVDWRRVTNIACDQLILAPLKIFISKPSYFKSWLIESSCYRILLV
jgi:hypothetical protein